MQSRECNIPSYYSLGAKLILPHLGIGTEQVLFLLTAMQSTCYYAYHVYHY